MIGFVKEKKINTRLLVFEPVFIVEFIKIFVLKPYQITHYFEYPIPFKKHNLQTVFHK